MAGLTSSSPEGILPEILGVFAAIPKETLIAVYHE
jgi:hypothetical protein